MFEPYHKPYPPRHLEQQGYLILETNWRSGHKEIDIIAKGRDDVEKQFPLLSISVAGVSSKVRRLICSAQVSEIAAFMKENAQRGDIIITMGAGDVVKIGDMIKNC